jgi:hypothetical protein
MNTSILLTLLLAAQTAAAQTTPQELSRSGRWFTYKGAPIYLVGWDTQELAADPSVDYVAALDLFKQYRLNKTRIWIYPYWNTSYLQPWPYASGKYNLDAWNAAYWTRIKSFMAAAQARDIIVEVAIFAANNIDTAAEWSNTATRPAWNKAFNTNNAFSGNASGYFNPQFFDLAYPERSSSGRTLKDYQQLLVDKTIAELKSFPNVYFEIANEFPDRNADIDSVYPWQLFWAQRISSATPRLVTTHSQQFVGPHTTGIQYFWDKPYIDVLNFHFNEPDANIISSLLHAAQTKGKVLELNETLDPYPDLNGMTRQLWAMFTAGGHCAFYEDDSNRIGTSAWVTNTLRLRALRDIVAKLRFWELSPVDAAGNELDALVTQGPAGSNHQVIAKVGSEYLAYFWGTKSTTAARLQLPAGTYSYEWYDVRNALALGSGLLQGGTPTIAAPPIANWDGNAGLVLIVKAASAPRDVLSPAKPRGLRLR